MEDEYYEWENTKTYDSSGLRIPNHMEKQLKDILEDQVHYIPIFPNPKKSVGQYIGNS